MLRFQQISSFKALLSPIPTIAPFQLASSLFITIQLSKPFSSLFCSRPPLTPQEIADMGKESNFVADGDFHSKQVHNLFMFGNVDVFDYVKLGSNAAIFSSPFSTAKQIKGCCQLKWKTQKHVEGIHPKCAKDVQWFYRHFIFSQSHLFLSFLHYHCISLQISLKKKEYFAIQSGVGLANRKVV